ncbi:MAG TPA: hypothetical protein VF003_05060 [Pseudonocardiaceae bacterium]
MIGSAQRQAEQALTPRIRGRVPAEAARRILALIARRPGSADHEGHGEEDEDEDAEPLLRGDDRQAAAGSPAALSGAELFAVIREEPGNVSVTTMRREVFKLGAIEAIGLPAGLFDDIAPGVLAAWRARVAAEAPSHLRRHADELTVTLLAAYLYCRRQEIIDTLVDLLITTVQPINARADTVVTNEFVAELKRVSGKENILFKMTGAALQGPNEIVSEVIYPAVPGGVDTLVALWRQFQSKGSGYRQHRQRVFKACYTNHYRAGLIQIIEVLEFGSANTVHAPVMAALALIKRYRAERTHHTKYYWTRCPSRGICAGSKPRSGLAGAWSRCWTCSPRPRCAPDASTLSSPSAPGPACQPTNSPNGCCW